MSDHSHSHLTAEIFGMMLKHANHLLEVILMANVTTAKGTRKSAGAKSESVLPTRIMNGLEKYGIEAVYNAGRFGGVMIGDVTFARRAQLESYISFLQDKLLTAWPARASKVH